MYMARTEFPIPEQAGDGLQRQLTAHLLDEVTGALSSGG
jgi:hypothetical protein